MPTEAASARQRQQRESFDDQPQSHFCCCEFVDRHGQQGHLADASALDKVLHGGSCTLETLRGLVYDLDDRVRLPMHGGAIHLGFCGMVPLLALPVLGATATRSARDLARLAAAVPLALVVCAHFESYIGRRFFQLWCACSLVLGHATLTFAVGEHVLFLGWLLASAAHMAAAVSAHVAAHGGGRVVSGDGERAPLRGGLGARPDRAVVWLGFEVRADNRPAVVLTLAASAVATATTAALSLGRACELQGANSVLQLARAAWKADESSIEMTLGVGGALASLHALHLCARQLREWAREGRGGEAVGGVRSPSPWEPSELESAKGVTGEAAWQQSGLHAMDNL